MLERDAEQLLKHLEAKWIAIGLSTAPLDRATITRAVAYLYLGTGVVLPPIEWLQSPREAVLRRRARTLPMAGSLVVRLPKSGVFDLPEVDLPVVRKWARFYTIRIQEAYETHADDAARDEYDVFMRGEGMARRVTAAVWNRCGQLIDTASEFSETFPESSLHTGSHLGDLAFYEFWWAYRGMNLKHHPTACLFQLSQVAGWVLPFEDACWVVARPATLNLGSGAPLAIYSDGFRVP